MKYTKKFYQIKSNESIFQKVDEACIAKLMMSCLLLTSVVGQFVQINTYYKPGVEAGKKTLKEKLTEIK